MKDNIYTTPNKNIETYQEGHSAKTKNAPPSMLKTNLRRGLRSSFDTSKSSPSLATSAKSEVINIPEIQTDSSRMDIEDVEDENDRWVTVFGFPQNYTSIVTKYFGDCGEIIKQKHAENQGNWIHLLFRTKLDAERALGKNGKIIDSKLNIMIGVIKTSKIMNINKLDKMETIKQPEIERYVYFDGILFGDSFLIYLY